MCSGGQEYRGIYTVALFYAKYSLVTGRAAIDMVHIKRDFSLKAWVRAPGVDLGVGQGKNLNFSE